MARTLTAILLTLAVLGGVIAAFVIVARSASDSDDPVSVSVAASDPVQPAAIGAPQATSTTPLASGITPGGVLTGEQIDGEAVAGATLELASADARAIASADECSAETGLQQWSGMFRFAWTMQGCAAVPVTPMTGHPAVDLIGERSCVAAGYAWNIYLAPTGCRAPDYDNPADFAWAQSRVASDSDASLEPREITNEADCEALGWNWNNGAVHEGKRFGEHCWSLAQNECRRHHNLVWTEGRCYYPAKAETPPALPIMSAEPAVAEDRSNWTCGDYSRATLNLYWTPNFLYSSGYEYWWENEFIYGDGDILQLRVEARERNCPLAVIVDTATECGAAIQDELTAWTERQPEAERLLAEYRAAVDAAWETGAEIPDFGDTWFLQQTDSATEYVKRSLILGGQFLGERCYTPGYYEPDNYDAPSGAQATSCGTYRSYLAQGISGGAPWKVMREPDAYPASKEWHAEWQSLWREFQRNPKVTEWIYGVMWIRPAVDFETGAQVMVDDWKATKQEELGEYPMDAARAFLAWCPAYYTLETG